MVRVLLAAAVGAACAFSLLLATDLVTSVSVPSFEVDDRLKMLLTSVGALIAGMFGFLTRRDLTRRNQQDPRGLHPPPDVPP